VRAVVDAGAHLIASLRMGGAWLGSIEIAQNKAYTARAFDMTTKDLAKISQARPTGLRHCRKYATARRHFPRRHPAAGRGPGHRSDRSERGKPDQDHSREAIMCCRKGGTLSMPGVYGGLLDKIPIGALMNKALTLKAG
jgi:threonine dehydrogenase-like Zn-dependent dehydrogenase